MAERLEEAGDRYTERILARIPADRQEDVLHAMHVLVDALDELPESCG
jgi:hypothetical protein